MQKDNYYLAVRNYGEGRKQRMERRQGERKDEGTETDRQRQTKR